MSKLHQIRLCTSFDSQQQTCQVQSKSGEHRHMYNISTKFCICGDVLWHLYRLNPDSQKKPFGATLLKKLKNSGSHTVQIYHAIFKQCLPFPGAAL